MPKISVIVPVYNVKKYLRQCLDSILAQTMTDFELICVDDGSKDGGGAVCDAYAEKDRRVTVIHQPNQGLSAARNTGLQRAAGEWLFFVDSDDWIDPAALETLYRRAEETGADMAVCGYYLAFEKTGETEAVRVILDECMSGDAILKSGIRIKVYPVVWNKLYRRALFEQVRFPVGRTHEDEFVYHELLHRARSVAPVNGAYYYYRQRDISIMSKPWSISRMDAVDARLTRCETYTSWNGFEKQAQEELINAALDYGGFLTDRVPEFTEEYRALAKRYTRTARLLIRKIFRGASLKQRAAMLLLYPDFHRGALTVYKARKRVRGANSRERNGK